MNIERRVFSLDDVKVEQRTVGEKKATTIRGHASVFNKLSENLGGYREVIAEGAFDNVLNDDVRALFNHDPNLILGRTVSGTMQISIDKEGLNYQVDLPETQTAKDLSISMERGDITQSSFAFSVDEEEWEEDDDGRVIRTITKVKKLFDVSPVTYPAYPDADVGLRNIDTAVSQRNYQNFLETKKKIHESNVSETLKRLRTRLRVQEALGVGMSYSFE